jgi:tetratricopeptide (TPR) repeat protein
MDASSRSTLKSLQHEAGRLTSEGEFGQAISVHYSIIRRYRDNDAVCERAYIDLGDVHLILMELDLAENYFKLALGYSPVKPHIHYLLGFSYSLNDQWDLAITEFRFCTDQDPERFEYWYLLGWVQHRTGNRIRAIECLRCAAGLKTTEAAIADLSVDLFLHPEKVGILSYARLALRVAPRNRYAKWILKYLQDLHDMACTLSPPFNGN